MLTLEFDAEGCHVEVHVLQVGESFPKFGGSRHALHVEGTPSIILRTKSGGTLRDTEYGISDRTVWQWIAERINQHDGVATSFGSKTQEG